MIEWWDEVREYEDIVIDLTSEGDKRVNDLSQCQCHLDQAGIFVGLVGVIGNLHY